jgi:hypothetical protein
VYYTVTEGMATDEDSADQDVPAGGEPDSDGTEPAADAAPPDTADDEERKEYYLSLIRKIVDEQKELLGRKAALKQARRAPLHINKDGDIVDFYGSGEKALETLRQFTEHQELYLTTIREVVTAFKNFLGEKTTLAKARKAPLFIDKDGNVSAYYGNGRNAVDILTTQFETVLGETVAHRKIRGIVRETVPEGQWELLPNRIQPRMQDTGTERRTLINRIRNYVDGVIHG